MAKIGIRKVMVAKRVETEGTGGVIEVSYSDGMQLGTTAGFTGSPNSNDVTDYGDDYAVETDKSVTGGTISLEQNNLTLEEKAFLLGHTIGTTGATLDEMEYKSEDIAPYVGIGAIGVSRRGGADVYVGKWYTKVQFAEPSDENQTKAESITFTHTTIEGTILIPEDKVWKNEKEFDSETAAVAWLKGKANISN